MSDLGYTVLTRCPDCGAERTDQDRAELAAHWDEWGWHPLFGRICAGCIGRRIAEFEAGVEAAESRRRAAP